MKNLQNMSDPAETSAGELAPSRQAAAEAAETGQKQKHNGFWADQWKRVKKYRYVLWFILPAALFSLVFSYVPMLGVLFAFKENYTSLGDPIWNLFHQPWTIMKFAEIFRNAEIGRAVVNTLIINVIRLGLCFPLSIIIAVMLSELKSQTFAKVILIIITIPNFLSWAIVIGIWSGMFATDFGLIGRFTGNLMRESSWFKTLVIFLSAWKGAGWGCILYYSAIASIDKTYYESATLEGANRLQKMWYLTIPSIIPTIALTLVLNISGMMSVGFEQVWTMMKASTDLIDSQITLDTYIYNISIGHGADDIPFATAVGVVNGAIALALMLIGNKITTKTLKRGLW